MNVSDIQKLLTAKFAGDHVRIARMAHFMGLLKTGMEGMASLGIVMVVEVEGLDGVKISDSAPDPLSSLDAAIAQVAGTKQ